MRCVVLNLKVAADNVTLKCRFPEVVNEVSALTGLKTAYIAERLERSVYG